MKARPPWLSRPWPCRVPIVATDVGGTRQLMTDQQHGLLVPPRRPDRLAESIQETIADPAATRRRVLRGTRARRHGAEFSATRRETAADLPGSGRPWESGTAAPWSPSLRAVVRAITRYNRSQLASRSHRVLPRPRIGQRFDGKRPIQAGFQSRQQGSVFFERRPAMQLRASKNLQHGFVFTLRPMCGGDCCRCSRWRRRTKSGRT